jgi:hypothetical protein
MFASTNPKHDRKFRMTTTVSILSQIALDAREFADAARTDGFDPADALDQIVDIAKLAEKKLDGIPLDAPIAVLAILGSESMCDDVLDMVEFCFEHVVRDRTSALAVQAKLQTFLDLYGTSESDTCAHACSSAEGDAWDRAHELVGRISTRHPGKPADAAIGLNSFIFDETLSAGNKEAFRAAMTELAYREKTPYVLRPDQLITSAGNTEVEDTRTNKS